MMYFKKDILSLIRKDNFMYINCLSYTIARLNKDINKDKYFFFNFLTPSYI